MAETALAETARRPYIKAQRISRVFSSAGKTVSALRAVDLELFPGDACAVTGPSGSGKSTLLSILGLLDKPDAGILELDGRDISLYSSVQLAQLRNREIGIVFQAFSLLQNLDAVSNVALPLIYRGMKRAEAKDHAVAALERVRLLDRAHHRPADLSGGQRQRVAIARALVGAPRVILADEPTAALDPDNARHAANLLLEAVRERGATLVLVTHDMDLARHCNRRVEIRDGALREMTLRHGT